MADITSVKPSALAALTENLQRQIDANKQQSIVLEAEVTKVIHSVGDLALQFSNMEHKMADSFKAVHATMAEIMASIQKTNRDEKPRRSTRTQMGKDSLGS